MALPICRTCGSIVNHVVQNVTCTVCCARCCMSADPILVTKTRALQLGCVHEDLARLEHVTARNPHRFSTNMFLYLREEAVALGEERRASKRSIEDRNARERFEAASARRSRLRSRGIHETSVPEKLRDIVFGDHFKHDRKTPSTTARHVAKHYAAAVRAKELLSPFPEKSSATHEVVLRYALTHENSSLRAMFACRDLARDVLDLVATRVVAFVGKADRERASLAMPEFCRATKFAATMRAADLEAAFRRAGIQGPSGPSLWRLRRYQEQDDVIPAVVRTNESKRRLYVWPDDASRRPRWTANDVALACKAFEVTRHDPVRRRKGLEAISKMDFDECAYKVYKGYVDGTLDADPEEVVAVATVLDALVEISMRAFDVLRMRYEGLLREYVWQRGATWQAATERVLRAIADERRG